MTQIRTVKGIGVCERGPRFFKRDSVLGTVYVRLPRVPLEHGSVYTKHRVEGLLHRAGPVDCPGRVVPAAVRRPRPPRPWRIDPMNRLARRLVNVPPTTARLTAQHIFRPSTAHAPRSSEPDRDEHPAPVDLAGPTGNHSTSGPVPLVVGARDNSSRHGRLPTVFRRTTAIAASPTVELLIFPVSFELNSVGASRPDVCAIRFPDPPGSQSWIVPPSITNSVPTTNADSLEDR